MIMLHLHHFWGIFLAWNLPQVFHSCLFQMDICFRENALQRKEFWLYGHKNKTKNQTKTPQPKVKRINGNTQAIAKLLRSGWQDTTYVDWVPQQKHGENIKKVEIKIWVESIGYFVNEEANMLCQLRDNIMGRSVIVNS